jgi:hypothetical protein
MNKITSLLIVLFISAGLSAHPDETTPANPSGYSWHSVRLVDFKPGTEQTARQFIEKFESASMAAGTEAPQMHWFESGKYDLVITWKLDHNPEGDNWTWCPEEKEWWNALVNQEGSEEAARKIQSEYNALIETSVTNVSRKAN